MNTAIAQHLNVTESAIIRVEEWANVIFTVVRGLGARFVSKKVVKMENDGWIEADVVDSSNPLEIRQWDKGNKRIVLHKNSGYWASEFAETVCYPTMDSSQPLRKVFEWPIMHSFKTFDEAANAIATTYLDQLKSA